MEGRGLETILHSVWVAEFLLKAFIRGGTECHRDSKKVGWNVQKRLFGQVHRALS